MTRYAKNAATAVLIAFIWIAAFTANEIFFADNQHSVRANWIILPAAIRLLAVLLFEKTGVIGLSLGAFLITSGNSAEPWMHNAGLALTSGLAPFLAVQIYRRLGLITRDLSNLRASDICSLSLASALSNALILNSYLALAGRFDGNPVQILTVFVGDTLGIVVILGLLSIALSFSLARRR